jgi:KipI family sensor histidine kinase inhibitor
VASRFEGLAGMKNLIEKKLAEDFTGHLPEGRLHEVPCEYNGGDLASVASQCGISEAEVIRLHSEKEYTVYFLGFLPGFAYMGTTDARITVARKVTPAPIQQGDIGLAGNQTGIYPSASPGGWQIIGRTTDIPHFRAGDRVRFIPVTV